MKDNLIKKVAFSTLAFIYDITSLFWCYVIIKSLIFEFSTVKIGVNGIDIIGGSDISTLIYKMGNVTGVVFPVMFILLSVVSIFLLNVSIFKKQINRKLNILLSVFIALSIFISMMIPFRTYYVSSYLLVIKFTLLKYTRIFYIIISLIIIVTNILVTIKRIRKTQ